MREATERRGLPVEQGGDVHAHILGVPSKSCVSLPQRHGNHVVPQTGINERGCFNGTIDGLNAEHVTLGDAQFLRGMRTHLHPAAPGKLRHRVG